MKELISRLTLKETVESIFTHKFGVILCCTLNEVLMAHEKKDIEGIFKRAMLVTPDGMPLVYYLRWKYGQGERVYGPDILRMFLSKNKKYSRKSLFIGDDKNEEYFKKIGKYMVLPFKNSFTEVDYKKIALLINKMEVDVVWLGLGAEKQVRMADGLARHGVKKVIITVGAAFDFLSGIKRQAPLWMQKSGTEWLFRMASEPSRLTKRYLKIFGYVVGRFWR